MSLSESSTQATYRFRYDVVAAVVRANWFAWIRKLARPSPAGVVQWQNISFPS
jgi:hypothetical protein